MARAVPNPDFIRHQQRRADREVKKAKHEAKKAKREAKKKDAKIEPPKKKTKRDKKGPPDKKSKKSEAGEKDTCDVVFHALLGQTHLSYTGSTRPT